MSVQLLSLGNCLLYWHRRVDALWHQTPRIQVERCITRGPRAGVQETIVRRGRRTVTDGGKATGEALLKQYRRTVERLLAQPLLLQAHRTDTGQLLLPSILVDARQLMQKRSLTERTMRTHLAQLIDIGFIVRKKWHGRQRSFELWINPDFILKPAQNPPEMLDEPAVGQATSCAEDATTGTKFPVNELPDLPETQKYEIGGCGKNASDDEAERPFPETEGRQAGRKGPHASEWGTGGGGGRQPALPPAVDKWPAVGENQAKYAGYLTEAWLKAQACVYPGIRFNEQQQQLAQQAILRGVYAGFQDPHFNYDAYHRGVLRRLELVELHFARHQGRYKAGMPWAEMIKGKGYFDAENAKGFRGTIAWLVADRKAYQLSQLNKAVAEAIRELTLRRKLDRGQKTPLRLAARIKATSFAALYQQHIARLDQLAGQLGTDKLNKRVLALL
ncbi:hypothetical protein [Hymenobacter pini]|uniref:hypothetical protein n=1 Tax=Hymenobacter pini TaxID=2880879 RepID=UPI001CF43FFB|nr:hypothetical protein [Hymenobacter pini]MCA8830490.1 hypothetical protein [Hymenobacter pini]